jgi:drug/metabolite transporter (DMT)-like permease
VAQTKRKRRSKHRGNAAGQIEARGRTGRRPSADEVKKTSRQSARDARMSKPPSWRSAFLKAALMAGLLFFFITIGLFGQNTDPAQGVILAVFAVLFYTPIAYATDNFVYKRYLKRQGQSKG